MSNLMSVRPVGDELRYVDGQTHKQTHRIDEIDGRYSQLFERTYKTLSHVA
jgi:hypothetical protein